MKSKWNISGLWLGWAILLAGAYVYAPALTGGWLWDDDIYITANPVLHSTGGLGKIWVAPAGVNYFPLTATVQWCQWHLWGNHTLGYHLTNLGLHLFSALLIWRLLLKLGVRWGWLGGMLFAVHPVCVESVAWISELKNSLSLPLLLLSLSTYVDWDSAMRREVGSAGVRYALSLALFLAAMLCKSTVVMLPVLLLLHAGWKRGRIDRTDIRGTIPFFAVSLLLGLITVWFEHHRAIDREAVASVGLAGRFDAGGLAAAFYFCKCAFPVEVLTIYPKWSLAPPSAVRVLPGIGIGLGLGWLWLKRARDSRTALFGLGFFFVNLLPILGFVPMAYQRISWVADHFAYLPLVGLTGLAAAALSKAAERGKGRRWTISASAAVILAILMASSHRLAAEYRSGAALWTRAVEGSPESWLAHDNLGQALAGSGELAEAAAQYREALRLNPASALAHNNLAGALARMPGRLPEAISHYEMALQLHPDFPEAENNLGRALAESGRKGEALTHFQAALRLKPDYADAHNNLGVLLGGEGRLDEAMREFEEAVRLEPDNVGARRNLGRVRRFSHPSMP